MELPTHTLTDHEINELAKELDLPDYLGTLMSDDVIGFKPHANVCAVINLEPRSQGGTHWTSFAVINSQSYYFDSYGTPPPDNLLKFLKTEKEYAEGCGVIQSNAIVVQKPGSTNCGALSLFVLFYLTLGVDFEHILKYLHQHRHKVSLWLPLHHRHLHSGK